MMQPVHDPYRVLGVARDATASQIKAAHRRLAKRHHPDAPEGDTTRFLAIQQAYQVLADPLARRAWDARHQAGPWRADERGAPGGVRERRPGGDPAATEHADGAWGGRAGAPASGARPGTRPGGTARGGPARGGGGPDAGRPRQAGWDGSGRDASAGSYTWSARDVPWWEEGGSQGARRQPGRRRPRAASPADEGRRADARGPDRPAGTGPPPPDARAGGRAGGRSRRPLTGEAPGPSTAEGTTPPEMDVYSRSSGAAWSSAARAYFRRHDLPAPGRRSAWARPGTRPGDSTSRGAPTRSTTGPSGASGTASRATGTRPAPSRPQRGVTPGPARTFGQRVGGRGTTPWRAPVAGRAASGPWPPLPQRVTLALLAWAPLAVAIAYGGDAFSGCGRGAVSCAPFVPPLQVALAVGLLGLLLLAPRGAYLAAAGTIGLALGSAAALFIIAVLTAGGTIPDLFVGAGFVLAIVAYVVAVQQAVRDTPFVRPWLSRDQDAGVVRRGDGAW